MKYFKSMIIIFCLFTLNTKISAQCSQTLTINSSSAECNGDGTSSVTINISVAFGNGNNSVVLSYNLGSGEVATIVIEDDNGDIENQTYMFIVPSCDNYSVSLTGWTNPSGSGSSCSNPATTSIVLPVKFGYFDISNNGRNIILEWSTLTETNNEKFEVQKADAMGIYRSIGEVKGAINSLREVHYKFLDENLATGTYYYRLKQIDLDGKSFISEIRTSNVKRDLDLLVYPNPAQEYITITTNENDTFRIVDCNGKTIESIYTTDSHFKYDISLLKPGLYILQNTITAETTSFVKQ